MQARCLRQIIKKKRMFFIHLSFYSLNLSIFGFLGFRLVRYGGDSRKWDRNLWNVGEGRTVRGYRAI